MKTIVALVDFSDVTPKVMEQSQKLAKAFDARVVLLHTVPSEPVVMELGVVSPTVLVTPSERRIEADYDKLLDLRDSLAVSGVNVSAQQLEDGSVKNILEESQRLHADLIVVGSHHHNALYNLLVGSFTGSVLKAATCPVLVVPQG